MEASTLRAARFGPPKGYSVLGSEPRHTVKLLGAGVPVGNGSGVSVATAVDSAGEEGNPHEERIDKNRKAINVGQYLISCFMEFTFTKNFPHYKGDGRYDVCPSPQNIYYFLFQSSSSRLFFCLPRYKARAM